MERYQTCPEMTCRLRSLPALTIRASLEHPAKRVDYVLTNQCSLTGQIHMQMCRLCTICMHSTEIAHRCQLGLELTSSRMARVIPINCPWICLLDPTMSWGQATG